MKISLYQAAEELEPLLDLIDEDGCIPPETEAALAQFETKGLSVAAYILNCEAHAKMIREAALAMDKRADPLEKRAERLKQYLRDNMKRTGILDISCPEFSAKLLVERDTLVVIENEAQIPIGYMRTPEPTPPVAKPDKKLIGDELKRGGDVPGARLNKSDRLVLK